MSGRDFSLTPQLSAFIDRQVDDGRHRNASEVVREALRRYADDLEAERASLAAIGRGDYRLVEGGEGSRALLDELNRRADARVKTRRRCA